MKSPVAKTPSRLALVCILVYAATLSFALTNLAATPLQSVSIDNFGKVNDNYYRGEQPDEAGFAELKRLGIKTIIDLRKDSLESAPPAARGLGLQYFNIPLTTKSPATEEQTDEFLKLVNDPANWPVYVHCKGGRHRTGEMTAIFRITHDRWTAAQAYAEMKKYDFEDGFFYPKVLKKHVFAFYERFSAANHE
jgi:protein tyrosine/serine phosphatase